MRETKVLIIGAGPSGITAAIYLHRSNIPFIILEKYIVGGKVATTAYIENYPGFNKADGVEFALKLQDQLSYNNIEITYDEIISLKKEDDYFLAEGNEETYKANYVIVASGTEEQKLNLQDEQKYLARGISFCAICDGALYKNKEVALVGGGNSALEEALYLSSIAKKIYLIHRRNEFRGDELALKEIKEKNNIEILTPYIISSYVGEKKLEGLILEQVDSKKQKEIKVEGLFVYIGSQAKNDFIKEDIKMNKGYIVTNEYNESSIKGLYAVGDIKDKVLRQVVTATNDGAIAAIAIQRELKKK